MPRPDAIEPRFQAGDRVAVHVAYPLGHVRTPYYLQGELPGVVERLCGVFGNPEELAYRDDDLCGICLRVDVVCEFRIPIAEAVRGIREPAEITIGAPAQRLFGNRGFVLERLQLGDFVQQIGEITVFGTGNLGAVIEIGAHGWAGNQRRRQRDD